MRIHTRRHVQAQKQSDYHGYAFRMVRHRQSDRQQDGDTNMYTYRHTRYLKMMHCDKCLVQMVSNLSWRQFQVPWTHMPLVPSRSRVAPSKTFS